MPASGPNAIGGFAPGFFAASLFPAVLLVELPVRSGYARGSAGNGQMGMHRKWPCASRGRASAIWACGARKFSLPLVSFMFGCVFYFRLNQNESCSSTHGLTPFFIWLGTAGFLPPVRNPKRFGDKVKKTSYGRIPKPIRFTPRGPQGRSDVPESAGPFHAPFPRRAFGKPAPSSGPPPISCLIPKIRVSICRSLAAIVPHCQ